MNDNAIAAIGGTGRVALGGLAQRLVQDGLLDEQTMQDAIAKSKEKRLSLVTHLVASNLATARDIAISACHEFGVPLLDLDSVALDQDAVRAVSEKLLQKHRVLPLMKRGKRLFLAVADPTNLHALDEIRFQTSMSIEFVVVEDDKLQMAVGKAMDQAEAAMPSLTDDDFDLENLEVTGGEEEPSADALGRDEVEDAPIVRFVNKILLDAIKKGASDIHFEPYEKMFRIRTRLDGVLKEVALPPVQLATKLVARLKVMARLDIAERRVPQDGRIKMRLSKNRAIDFRVSTCPTLFGEKVVTRLLDPSSAMLGIDALGYEPFQREIYMRYLAKPQGMILVTGPTGSGKTVSLYTGLNILNTEDCNISTAEVPAEAMRKEGLEESDIASGIRLYKAVGCGQCTDGYKGRLGIYQVMPVTDTIGRLIMEGGGALNIGDQAAKDGVWNLRRSGLQKVKDGLTSLEEVNNITIE